MKNKLSIGNKSCNNKKYRNKFVIALIILLTCINQPISCDENESYEAEPLPINNFVEKCEQRCKDQVRVQTKKNHNQNYKLN